MPAREEVKYLLLKKKMTIIELAKELTEKTGHKYTRQGISNKLHRGTLRFDEVEEIAKILGYEIKFKEISDYKPYSLTPPIMIPLMKYFCPSRNTPMTGITEITAHAMSCPHSVVSLKLPLKIASPTGKVRI